MPFDDNSDHTVRLSSNGRSRSFRGNGNIDSGALLADVRAFTPPRRSEYDQEALRTFDRNPPYPLRRHRDLSNNPPSSRTRRGHHLRSRHASPDEHDLPGRDLRFFDARQVSIDQLTQNVYQDRPRQQFGHETNGFGPIIHKPDPWPTPSDFPERSGYEVYSQYMFLQRRGIPLWEPRPSEKALPSAYRKKGIDLGDVGIVDPISGRFIFLFNLFLPASHEINRGRVPDGFIHLEKSKVESAILNDDSLQRCFASSSLREMRSSDFEFQTTGREGAVLVVPDGGVSEDLSDDSVLKEYIITHAKAWWGQIRGNTEYGVYVIVGMDKVPRWGMATFQNVDEPLEFELVVKEESRIWPSCVWKGVHGSKAGPGEMDRLLMGSDMVPLRNQCVFIRTLNFLVSTKLPEELTVQVACPNCSKEPLDDSSQDPTTREPKVHIKSWKEGLPTSSPARLLNQYLLKHCPNAEVVITRDADWISVITEADAMPSPEDILTRVLRSHNICQNKGVVTLEKIDTTTKSNPATITHQDILPTNQNEVGCYCTFDNQGVTELGGDDDSGMDCDEPVLGGSDPISQSVVAGSSTAVKTERDRVEQGWADDLWPTTGKSIDSKNPLADSKTEIRKSVEISDNPLSQIKSDSACASIKLDTSKTEYDSEMVNLKNDVDDDNVESKDDCPTEDKKEDKPDDTVDEFLPGDLYHLIRGITTLKNEHREGKKVSTELFSSTVADELDVDVDCSDELEGSEEPMSDDQPSEANIAYSVAPWVDFDPNPMMGSRPSSPPFQEWPSILPHSDDIGTSPFSDFSQIGLLPPERLFPDDFLIQYTSNIQGSSSPAIDDSLPSLQASSSSPSDFAMISSSDADPHFDAKRAVLKILIQSASKDEALARINELANEDFRRVFDDASKREVKCTPNVRTYAHKRRVRVATSFCILCHGEFTTKANLQHHYYSHLQLYQYRCHRCGDYFRQLTALRRHDHISQKCKRTKSS